MAAVHLREALQLTEAITAVPYALEIYVHTSELLILHEREPEARKLLAFVWQHPGLTQEVRTMIQELLVRRGQETDSLQAPAAEDLRALNGRVFRLLQELA